MAKEPETESDVKTTTKSTKSNCTTTPKNMSSESPVDTNHDPCAGDWQSTKNNVKERLEYIFENKLYCDVQFIVGSSSNILKIGAHRLLLKQGSHVFHTMFEEKWSSDHKEVEVPDVEPAAFTDLLRFLYSDHIVLTPESVSAVLYAAKKYAVLSLENKCVSFLLSQLCPDNAFSILIQGRLFNARALVDACLVVIAENTIYTLETDDFCSIDEDTLCLVLDRSDLRIHETLLFEAVLRWSDAACKKKNMPVTPATQRLALKKALKLIRFPLMESNDFASKVVPTGILSEEEVISVSMYFFENLKPQDCIFKDTPRRTYLTASRFQSIVTGGAYGDTSSLHKLIFQADCKINLLGFGLYGSPDHAAFYPVEVTLQTQASPPQVLREYFGTHDGSKKIFRVMFTEPVDLTANIAYLLQVKIQGKYFTYGCGGAETVAVNIDPEKKATITFSNSEDVRSEQDRGKKTDKHSGQIPEILFEV